MILEKASIAQRKYFLIEFTRKLIRASSKEDFFELKTFVEEDEKEKQEKIEKPLTNEAFTKKIEEKVGAFPRLKRIEEGKPPIPKRLPRRRLIIPEYRLPPTFQYLKPTFTRVDIDLGKLNPLLKDSMVREIQCNGPEKKVVVKGAMGTKESTITLTKEDVESILEAFSKTAKIPIHGGITKIVVGNLVLSAITSEVIESKFIIKKMLPEPAGGRRVYGR